jgi:hypothetical protein
MQNDKPDLSNLIVVMREHAATASTLSTYDPKGVKESQALKEDSYEDIQRQKAETAGLKERNRDLRYNRKLRSAYARWVFCYLVGYSVFVGVLLIIDGFQVCGFDLEESVMSFLGGSTAVSAIGLVYAVTHGLFDGVGKR